mgnify:CR=1 FL=1
MQRYLAGEVPEDVFRVFRLNNGIYGQRQGGHNQMLRVKIPYGRIEPDQVEMLKKLLDVVEAEEPAPTSAPASTAWL